MRCLLLNPAMEPISILPMSIVPYQHAIKLWSLDKITILEEYEDLFLHSVNLTINYPAVAMTKEYFNYKRAIRFSRHNVFLRDLFQCQYCLDTFNREDLTIDHMIPRANGGKVTWNNAVTACKSCNHRKGDKLWKPARMPYKPDYHELIARWKSRPINIDHDSWYDYLGIERRKSA